MLMTESRPDQAAGLRRIARPQPVQVIAVTSGKGGVGKSNLSVNLGVAMAKSGHEVMILDADLGLANIDVLLGLHPEYNLSNVLKGERTLEEVVVRGPAGVMVVPAASGVQQMAQLGPAENAGVIRAFSELSMGVDRLLIDTAAGINDSVVSCDEPASITDAYAMVKVLSRDHGVQHFHVLANMTESTQHGLDLFGKLTKVADRFLDVTLEFLGSVPHDEYLLKAVRRQKPVVDAYPRSRSAMAFAKVAQKIDRWPLPEAAAGHLEFFVERLIRYSAESQGAYL